ncbi:MAG: EamA family transporter, partial [Cyanobacteria bacterium J06649_11]
FMFTATAVGLLGSWGNWRNPPQADYFYLISLGILGLFGQIFMTMALQREVASKVTPFKYLEAVFVIGLGYIFFQERQAFGALLGVGLIILGNVLNAVTKRAE